MSPVDLSFLVLAGCSTQRALALAPQVHQMATRSSDAMPVSLASWGLFLASHLSGAAYAALNARDWALARVFLGNAAGCAAILVTTGTRRIAHARRRRRHPAPATPAAA